MLDYQKFSQTFPIKRVTCSKNSLLCDELGVYEDIAEPYAFIITNSNDFIKRIDKFQDKMDLLNRDCQCNYGMHFICSN